MYTYTYIHIYIYTYIHIHLYIHLYIRIFTVARLRGPFQSIRGIASTLYNNNKGPTWKEGRGGGVTEGEVRKEGDGR